MSGGSFLVGVEAFREVSQFRCVPARELVSPESDLGDEYVHRIVNGILNCAT